MDNGMKPNRATRVARAIFGILMVLVYLGMAALMLLNYFQINRSVAIGLGVVFVVYGAYRAYRLYKGKDYFRID